MPLSTSEPHVDSRPGPQRLLLGCLFTLLLGNMAMSAYVILQLILLPPGSRPQEILNRR